MKQANAILIDFFVCFRFIMLAEYATWIICCRYIDALLEIKHKRRSIGLKQKLAIIKVSTLGKESSLMTGIFRR